MTTAFSKKQEAGRKSRMVSENYSSVRMMQRLLGDDDDDDVNFSFKSNPSNKSLSGQNP